MCTALSPAALAYIAANSAVILKDMIFDALPALAAARYHALHIVHLTHLKIRLAWHSETQSDPNSPPPGRQLHIGWSHSHNPHQA